MLGDWGEAENFTLPKVSPPENIMVSTFSVVRDNDLQISLEVIVQWIPPSDLTTTSSDSKRERRLAEENSADGVTAYEVLLSTDEESLGTDYGAAPTGPGLFSQRFLVTLLRL